MPTAESTNITPTVANTAEEVLGLVAAGLDDVLTKAFGEGQLSFTLLVHGPAGLFCVSNAERSASALAMTQITAQWSQEEQAMMDNADGCPNDD